MRVSSRLLEVVGVLKKSSTQREEIIYVDDANDEKSGK